MEGESHIIEFVDADDRSLVEILLTAREWFLIRQAADACGKPVGQWCKSLLVNEAELGFLESKDGHVSGQGS